jgi:transposase
MESLRHRTCHDFALNRWRRCRCGWDTLVDALMQAIFIEVTHTRMCSAGMKGARVRDGTLEFFEFLAEFPAIQAQIRPWLTMGLKASSSRTTETCRRLLAADPDLGRFVSVSGLEPANHRAEHALRHPVIWRRSSHGTQSDLGRRLVERILTVVETCRQQRPVFDFLRDALIAYPTGLSIPSLLPSHQP